MRAGLASALTLAAAALPAAARDLDCRAETVCRSAACAPAAGAGAGFVLAGADGPAPALLREGARIAVRAQVAAGAALVRFEGMNDAGRLEQVMLYPATGVFSWTRDAARRNAPVWSGTCRPAAPAEAAP